MSINGLRSPASSLPPPPHVAHGKPETATEAPAPGLIDTHRTALPARPPQNAAEAAVSPRIGLSKLGSVPTEPVAGGPADAALAIATKVIGEVDNGKLALLASHSVASLGAAASAAARGLMALRNEVLLPR
jgi:hypothetical protein